MTKLLNQLKKPCFGPFLVHFPNFSGKKVFLENLALSRPTSNEFLAPCQNSEKIMMQFQENTRTDGSKDVRTEGWKDSIS